MANYKNSLGESELFGRMTAGFAKICESVQSGKFVRDEMGVICESCNEAEDGNRLPPPPEEIPLDGTPKSDDDGATQDADVASATPEQINGSVNEGEKLTKGAVDAVVKSGSDNALTNSGDAPDGWTVLDAEGKTVVDFGTLDDVVAGAIEKGVEFDVDEDMLPKFRKWYDTLEEAKVVDEGIVGKTLGTIGGATVGSAIGGALGCPVAGGIAGGIAGASLTEGCDGKKKPMKKLIPEGCCGGKAKKVLKECGSTVVTEKKVPLCKTCGNPLDETGTCQDCQGYSPVKEGEGEIKLQIPAELKRKAALKANAHANKEKVAQAIRDGKAVGIVKEDAEEKIPDGVQLLMGILDKAFKLERGGSCPGEVPVNRVENGLEKKKPFSSGVLVKLNKEGKRSCCGVDDEGEYHLDELIVDEIIDEAGKRGLKVEFSPHHLDGFDGTFRIVDDSAFKNRTVEEGENAYVVKKGGIGYYVKDAANDRAVSPSFDTKEEAEQYQKDKFPAKEKGSVELTKDIVFGMLVNLLEQIRDGVSVEDVTANPDMEEFDDYTLDEVLELAKKYEV